MNKHQILKLASKAKPVMTADINKLREIAYQAIQSTDITDLAVYIISISPYHKSLGYKETLKLLEIGDL